MKRVITAMAAMSLVAAASAATYDGVYVSGLQQTISTGWGGGGTNYVGGLAFDPTQQTGGTYDRVYVANKTGWNSRRGLYSFDLTAGTVSSRLALGSAPSGTDADVDSPHDVAVDSSGTAYMINADSGGGVYKITDPSGTPTSSWMLGHYGSGSDNDGRSVVMVPTGFGGGYTAGSDVLAYDSYYDGPTNAILAVKSTSTSTANDYDVLWTEYPRQSGGLRIDSSNVDGKLYIARDNVINSDDLGDGTDRVYVTRLDGSGTAERVYIDGIDPASYSYLDDAIAINQDDGSLWFALKGTNSVEDMFRIDVANAVSTNGTYLADSSVVIADLGFNIYRSSMAISPDGKQLAIGGSSNTLQVYDVIPEPATLGLIATMGGGILWIRRKLML